MKLQHYKGIYYGHKEGTIIRGPKWVISDTEDGSGNVIYVNSNIYRIDQAIDMFREEMKKNKPNNGKR